MLNCLEIQTKRLKKISKLFSITLKNVKSNRFNKLISRNNYNKEKNKTLVNFALNLVYLLRVSKVAKRKALY